MFSALAVLPLARSVKRVLLTTVIATIGVACFATSAVASPPVALSGAWVESGSPSASQTFANWRGAAEKIQVDYFNYSNWSDVVDDSWLLGAWQGFQQQGGTVVLSVPLLVDSPVGTFAQGAAGAYDSNWKRLGQELVSSGDGSDILRLGWEFNQSASFPWRLSATNSAMGGAAFIAYWRRVVTILRSTPGSHFKFDWTVLPGAGEAGTPDAAGAYPGDDYVDYVGVDVYDVGWAADGSPINDAAARWQQIANQNEGLNWWASFAKDHGKQLSIPEWGIETWAGHNGGGDDPYFIEQMYNWMKANRPAYESYWDSDASLLSASNAPKSMAEYKALYDSAISSRTDSKRTASRADPNRSSTSGSSDATSASKRSTSADRTASKHRKVLQHKTVKTVAKQTVKK
jgi:hypothetical protein